MLSDIQNFYEFWRKYQTLCLMRDVKERSPQKRGYIFETKVQRLINEHFGVPVSGGMSNLRKCRGINFHQFDVEFFYNDRAYIGECKYTEREPKVAWNDIKDGLNKFILASFQRLERLRKDKQSRETTLLLFSNINLDTHILNDCIFNNVVFITPSQPYIKLALYLFYKYNGDLFSFNNQELYDILNLYTEVIFNCKNITTNTNSLLENMVEYYFSFIQNNSLLAENVLEERKT